MDLHYQSMGKGHPLIILHGLYGQGGNWLSIAKRLASFSEVYMVDQRNHGKSPHSHIQDYESMANDLKEFMDARDMDHAVILGHSMGGKSAMAFALANPGRVTKLIVADVSPASYHSTSGSGSHQAFHLNIMQTMLSVPFDKINTIGEVDEWMEPGIPDKRVRQFLLTNLLRKKDGGFEWQLNLPALIHNLGQLLNGIDLEAFGRKEVKEFPVLFIRGEFSYYIQESDIRLIKRIFPLAQIVTIKQAGHWLHAEQPEIFSETVRQFLIQ